MLSHLLEDYAHDDGGKKVDLRPGEDIIPLSNVTDQVMKLIIEYLDHHKDDGPPVKAKVKSSKLD